MNSVLLEIRNRNRIDIHKDIPFLRMFLLLWKLKLHIQDTFLFVLASTEAPSHPNLSCPCSRLRRPLVGMVFPKQTVQLS